MIKIIAKLPVSLFRFCHELGGWPLGGWPLAVSLELIDFLSSWVLG